MNNNKKTKVFPKQGVNYADKLMDLECFLLRQLVELDNEEKELNSKLESIENGECESSVDELSKIYGRMSLIKAIKPYLITTYCYSNNENTWDFVEVETSTDETESVSK